MLKIFADECIPVDIINTLREYGFDVITAFDEKLNGKTDEEIFKFVLKSKRVFITLDRGFGDIFRFDISKSFGVIIVLIKYMDKNQMKKVITSFLCQCKENDLNGRLIIIAKKRIRIIERG